MPDQTPTSDQIVSSLRIEKNSRHWRITVFNRGGNAGTLCVDASDGEAFEARLSGATLDRVAALEAENAALREDAARWRKIRVSLFVFTDEDDNLCLATIGDAPQDLSWVTDDERLVFTEGTIDRAVMPEFCDRFVDAARTSHPSEAE